MIELEKIARAGIAAPSGDNTQPWRFIADATGVEVHIDPHALGNIYDIRRRGSLVGIGAAIENLQIAARHFGHPVDVALFPNKSNRDHIATLRFDPSQGREAENDARLYELIFARTTNRKPYKKIPLTNDQRERLLSAAYLVGVEGRVRIIEDPSLRLRLSKLLSNSDKLIFLNRSIHDGLFEQFRWTSAEAQNTRTGLDVLSLEFSPIDRRMVKLLRSWRITKVMNSFGAADLIAKKTAQIYNKAAALCAVVMNGTEETHFINGGRIMERLWIEATGLGLAIQPVTALSYLWQRILVNEASMFSPKEIELIRKSFDEVRAIFAVSDETIVMVFRIGVAEGVPTARSVRKRPEDVIIYRG